MLLVLDKRLFYLTILMKLTFDMINYDHKRYNRMLDIGVAPITQLRTCIIKIVAFKGGHLMW